MTDHIGRAEYDLAANDAELRRDLAEAGRLMRSVGNQMESAFGRQGATAIKHADNASKGLLGRMNAMVGHGGIKGALLGGVGLGAGLSAFHIIEQGVEMVVETLHEAQEAYSDLHEQQTRTREVFKESGQEVLEWSETTARAFGIADRAALEGASSIGALVQGMGTSEEEAVKMSESLVELAGDLASFYNVAGGAEEVLQAIQSGLVGQSRPMRRYAVDISDAAVKTKLLNDGVQAVNGKFTNAQKIMARYQIILDKTMVAQGDYARTAMGSANQERTLAALREEALAKFGYYADNVVKVAQVLAIDFVGAVEGAIGILNDLNDLLFPEQKRQREAREAIMEMAAARGVDTAAVLAFYDAQQKQIQQQKEATDGIADYGIHIIGLTSITDAQIEAAGESTEATEKLDQAHQDAAATFDGFAQITKAEQQQLGQLGRHASLTEDQIAALDAETKKAAAEQESFNEKVEQANRDISNLVDQLDLSKKGFKDFWHQIAENRKRERYFLQHPHAVEEEVKRIRRQIGEGEDELARLEKVKGAKRNEGQIQVVNDRLVLLRGQLSKFYALGVAQGNQLEAGMETGFDPALGNKLVVDVQSAIQQIRQMQLRRLFPTFQTYSQPPGSQHGGPASGWRLVGEAGRELVHLPAGSHVVPHGQTERMLGGAGATFNVNILAPARGATPGDTVRALRRAANMGMYSPRFEAVSW